MTEAARKADPRIEAIRPYIRDIPDFPKAGILFKDITPLLAHPPSFREVTLLLAERAARRRPEAIVAVESRGFIFGAALAAHMGLPFVPVRKPGKLPYRTRRVEYALEYGTDALEMHEDALAPGARALVLDDVLATGGTAAATAQLVEQQQAVVSGLMFVVELGFLDGRKRLGGREIDALLRY